MDAELISERFVLGEPLDEPTVAASGWGQRNLVWRLETRRGVFAVKEVIAELLPHDPDTALRVESFAHSAGVPSAEPVPSSTGAAFELLDGRWYRCHRWIDGTAKLNEDTTAHDAHEMGILVTRLHQLQLDAGPLPPAEPYGQAHWLGLARHAPQTAWGRLIEEHLAAIESAEAFGSTFADTTPIGSHCDLNAHNVLFTPAGLALVDWDAAGPASAAYERASTAVLWAHRHDGRLDRDVAASFLRGYREGGGAVSFDDAAALPRWLTGLAWWTERNLQIALARSSVKHDELATQLVYALINGVDTVKQRQQFLQGVIATL